MPRPGGVERLLKFENIEGIPKRELRVGEEVGVRCRIVSLRGLYVHIVTLRKKSTAIAFKPSEVAWIREGLGFRVPEEKLVILEQGLPIEDNLEGFLEAKVLNPKPDLDEPRVVEVEVVDEGADITRHFCVRRSDLFVSRK